MLISSFNVYEWRERTMLGTRHNLLDEKDQEGYEKNWDISEKNFHIQE